MTKGISHLSATIANSPGRRTLVLALLAVFSALLSTYALSFWGVNGAPVLPGIYFGLVLGLGVFWITRRKSDLFTVLAVTTIAWFLAYQTARHVYEFIDSELGRIQKQAAPDSASVVLSFQVNYVLALCGALGGLVGSFLTGAGISFVSKEFYANGNWARTILIGMITGTLLEFASWGIGDSSFLPLFLVWQSSVAASIGYGLARKDRE
jgi:hypothetical protein